MPVILSSGITISDEDRLGLLDVLKDDAAIEAWVQEAVANKITKCRQRMSTEWVSKLVLDPAHTADIPSDPDALINHIVALTDYKNRAERDAES